MLKALLYYLIVHIMSPLFLLKALAVLMIGPHLDHEDLEQLDEFDLEEMDLKWSKRNQESRRRDAENTGYRAKDNGRRPRKHEEPKALVTLDGEDIDWTGHAEDEQENFALMAYSNSGSNTEILANFEGQAYISPHIQEIICLPVPDMENSNTMFTYGPKQYKTSESDTQTSNYDSLDDEYVNQPSKEQERPSFAFIDTVKHVKTPRETVKEQNTYSPSPKANKKD
ncbi:hypothetical protein Tco_1051391 [Tanacetum coccineum]